MKGKADVNNSELPFFSTEDAKNIIDATIKTKSGKTKFKTIPLNPQKLAKDLNDAVNSFEGWKKFDDAGKSSRKIHQKIEKAKKYTEKTIQSYNDLLESMQNLETFDPSRLKSSTDELISSTITKLDLVYWNLCELPNEYKTKDKTKNKFNGAKAKTDFMGRLLPEVYSKHFEAKQTIFRDKDSHQPISRDKDSHQPGGPMLRFIKSCLKHLKIEATDESIASSLAKKRLRKHREISI